MNSVYVIGGKRKKDYYQKQECNWFETGVIIELDPETGSERTRVEYVSPKEVCASDQDPSILFKAGSLKDDRLYVCTQTEILVFKLPEFRRIGYVSLPCFNDLHHVAPTRDGTLLVANSGLDMVVELALDGTVLREWDVLGETPWRRFSKALDYRQILSTKPHKSHPNYVAQINEDVWVTRFEQRDAVCLTRPGRRIEIGIGKPHDGIKRQTRLYYTAIDGHIIIVNVDSGYVEKVVNLNAITHPNNIALGWCRGLKVIDDSQIIVGFSRLRPTKWRENIQWAERQLGRRAGTLPTRLALYDLQREKLCWQYSMEHIGMDAIFSIHSDDG